MMDYHEDLGVDIVLNNDDWDILTKAHEFLSPFASATLKAEGKYASITDSLRLMDALLHHYEREKVGSEPVPKPKLMITRKGIPSCLIETPGCFALSKWGGLSSINTTL